MGAQNRDRGVVLTIRAECRTYSARLVGCASRAKFFCDYGADLNGSTGRGRQPAPLANSKDATQPKTQRHPCLREPAPKSVAGEKPVHGARDDKSGMRLSPRG